MAKKAHRFPCIHFKQGKLDLFLFAASAKDVWALTQINQREDDKDKGYQRALSTSRVAAVAQYVDRGNTLPLSVLISFDYAHYDAKSKELVVDSRSDAGWIIDGQHRLAGAHESEKGITIPVVAFCGLPIAGQIEQFITINREQKGVPQSLYLDLINKLPGPKSESDITKERAADLAQLMRKSEDSVFFNRIVVATAPRRGQISMTNFVRKVGPLIKKDGRLNIYSDDERMGVIDNYYRGLEQVFPSFFNGEEQLFFKTLGFGALLNALPVFLDVTLTNQKGFRVADAIATWKSVDYFDFGTWRGTGSSAEILASNDLRTELERSSRIVSSDGGIKLK